MTMAPDDPLIPEPRHDKTTRYKAGLLIIAVTLLAVAAYVLFYDKSQQANITPGLAEHSINKTEKTAVVLPPPTPEPIVIPQKKSDTAGELALPNLPSYENANNFLKEQLKSEQWRTLNIDEKLLPALDKQYFLQRSIAFLDGISKGEMPNKILPFTRPASAFVADIQGQTLKMGAGNFQRYNLFIQRITTINTQQAARFFHWSRPFLERAYGELGYAPEELSSALIRAINIALTTPEINAPINLKRESVFFQFADPSLESLPSIQKQILRMGPDNSTALKSWLTQLRQTLLITQ